MISFTFSMLTVSVRFCLSPSIDPYYIIWHRLVTRLCLRGVCSDWSCPKMDSNGHEDLTMSYFFTNSLDFWQISHIHTIFHLESFQEQLRDICQKELPFHQRFLLRPQFSLVLSRDCSRYRSYTSDIVATSVRNRSNHWPISDRRSVLLVHLNPVGCMFLKISIR